MGFKKRRIGDQANMHVAFFHATTSHFKPGLDLHITKSTEDSVCRRCYGKKKKKHHSMVLVEILLIFRWLNVCHCSQGGIYLHDVSKRHGAAECYREPQL